jgi:hypothetical protein
VAPVADSPLEMAGFEPSVPRWGNYAHETVPFDRYSISRPFSGAAQRIDRCFRRIDQHRQALVEAEAIAVAQASLLETRDRRGRFPLSSSGATCVSSSGGQAALLRRREE